MKNYDDDFDEHDRYLNVIMAECISNFSDKVEVGERYRLGIRYNNVVGREVYYLLDIKNALGLPIYVTIESDYFKEEELSSISFIMT
jgi:hypothetical protein